MRLSEHYFKTPDAFIIERSVPRGNLTFESIRERLSQEIQKIDQAAEACYSTCCETYKSLQLEESPELFQAINHFCLRPLFDQRRHQTIRLLERTAFATSEERDRTEHEFQQWLRIREIRWERRLEVDTWDAKEKQKRQSSLPKGIKPGPRRRLDQRFIDRAALLRAELKNDRGWITLNALKEIARKLDELELEHKGISYPGFCLEKHERNQLNRYNQINSRSNGAVTTWVALIEHGDKGWLESMRRVLSYCEQQVGLTSEKN